MKLDEIKIDEENFSKTIGVNIDSLTDECKSLLNQYDLKYRHLNKIEFEQALLDILQGMLSRVHLKSGPKRKEGWNIGWKSNLNAYTHTKKIQDLKPGYFRHEEYARYDGTYVKPLTSDFVFKFLKILQAQFYVANLKNIDNIFELGCGSGHNIATLAEIYPNKNFIGLDWSIESINTVRLLNEKLKPEISAHLNNWDMSAKKLFNLF